MPDADIGRMRNRVRLQKRSDPTPQPAGDDIPRWAEAGVFWAEVEPLSGRLLFLAQQAQATSDYSVRIRAGRTIEPLDNRFVFRGSIVLGIDSVAREDGRNEFLLIFCTRLKGTLP